jgi:hypothetical protein
MISIFLVFVFAPSYKIENYSFVVIYLYSYCSIQRMPPKLKVRPPPQNDDNEMDGGVRVTVGGGGGGSGGGGGGGTECSLFLSSLSPLERRVCQIAESHLESSFDLSRSSGYIAWKANQQKSS